MSPTKIRRPHAYRAATHCAWLAALFLTGCSKYYYNPSSQILPQYIRKIAVRPFANKTQQFRLEDKLTVTVESVFNQDGRYQITSEDQADGVLIGTITKYIHIPLAFDQNNAPTQFKLWILISIAFFDKVKNQTLWVEPNLGTPVIYYAASSGLPGAITDDEAQQKIWNQAATDILTRTLEGFGTVTGASDKAVPPENSTFNPPEPGESAPKAPTY